jgi:acyl-CoA synthetase (AMP-forming)/AMP-acid ligase II
MYLCVHRDSGVYELVEDGEEGELLIGGPHVCFGYIDANQTNSSSNNNHTIINNHNNSNNHNHNNKFINNHLDNNKSIKILFCTGDIVKKSKLNNQVYWICRRDFQIKIRGIRLDLSEVEKYLSHVLIQVNRFYRSNIIDGVHDRDRDIVNSNAIVIADSMIVNDSMNKKDSSCCSDNDSGIENYRDNYNNINDNHLIAIIEKPSSTTSTEVNDINIINQIHYEFQHQSISSIFKPKLILFIAKYPVTITGR